MEKQHNVKLVNMHYLCLTGYIITIIEVTFFVFGTSKTNIRAKYTQIYRVGHSASTTGMIMSSREVS